jgi:hypothetical protein
MQDETKAKITQSKLKLVLCLSKQKTRLKTKTKINDKDVTVQTKKEPNKDKGYRQRQYKTRTRHDKTPCGSEGGSLRLHSSARGIQSSGDTRQDKFKIIRIKDKITSRQSQGKQKTKTKI